MVEIGNVLGEDTDYQFVYQLGEEEKSWQGEETILLVLVQRLEYLYLDAHLIIFR